MTKEEFDNALKKAGLTKKGFADILGTDKQTVYNWGNGVQGVPYWVPSWIENYLKSEAYTRVKDEVLSIEGLCE